MVLDQELIDMMHDEIVLEHRTGNSRDNSPTYGPAATLRCYIARTDQEVIDRNGRSLTSTVQAILADPTVDVSTEDRLTLPDGSHPAIIQVLGAPDETGEPYHLEIRA